MEINGTEKFTKLNDDCKSPISIATEQLRGSAIHLDANKIKRS